ncbi:MAG: RNA-binding protein [Hyphomicrobiaceae bacterium]|nr:RNA-binding protein [Hyphomicrobiaceae bacterium]
MGKRQDFARQEARAPTRTCAATRSERPVDDLIRFVAGPGDAIVPDLAHKLPGRGVWVTADRQSVDKAVRGGAFAKSLKRKVMASVELPATVERLLAERAIAALALANKAGLVVTGFDKVDTLLERGEAATLVHALEAAAGGRDKLDRKHAAIAAAAGRQARIIVLFTIDEMGLALGRANVVHAALRTGGAAERFAREANRLSRYRSGVPLTLAGAGTIARAGPPGDDVG